MKNTLKVIARGEREIVITRAFNAARQLVWDAHTKPELVRRWLLGPPGWSMPVCEIDLRVGGRYRYVWRNQDGAEMGMGANIARSLRPSAWSRRSASINPGTPARRSTPRSSPRKRPRRR